MLILTSTGLWCAMCWSCADRQIIICAKLDKLFLNIQPEMHAPLQLDLQSSADLIRLQSVQNRAAGLVTQAKTQDHIRPTPVLRDLQW